MEIFIIKMNVLKVAQQEHMNKDIFVILAIQVALHVMDQIKMIAQVALI